MEKLKVKIENCKISELLNCSLSDITNKSIASETDGKSLQLKVHEVAQEDDVLIDH